MRRRRKLERAKHLFWRILVLDRIVHLVFFRPVKPVLLSVAVNNSQTGQMEHATQVFIMCRRCKGLLNPCD